MGEDDTALATSSAANYRCSRGGVLTRCGAAHEKTSTCSHVEIHSRLHRPGFISGSPAAGRECLSERIDRCNVPPPFWCVHKRLARYLSCRCTRAAIGRGPWCVFTVSRHRCAQSVRSGLTQVFVIADEPLLLLKKQFVIEHMLRLLDTCWANIVL